jgi:hypothetical protein
LSPPTPTIEELSAFGPNIIAGTGGSGTRVVARIARHGGMFIGTSLGPNNEDALEFRPFFDRWINPFLRRETVPLPPAGEAEMVRDFRAALERHCAELGPEPRPWGWKAPRGLYLLPFFHTQLPTLKLLHLVRDGRDMAYSKRRRHLKIHGNTVLDPTAEDWSEPLKLMASWNRVNLLALDYGEQHLAGRYLVVRFEDLCAEPVRTIDRIFAFLGLSGDAEAIARLEVATPESLGRWRQQDPETQAELHRIGEAALERFGYAVPSRHA